MKFPDNLHYTKEHMWAEQLEDGNWHVGITDYAQDLLGDVVFIDPPKVGNTLTAESPCGLIESVKTGSDLHAPLTGEVLAINEEVIESPEMINDKPYKAWIFTMRAESNISSHLMKADDYKDLIDA